MPEEYITLKGLENTKQAFEYLGMLRKKINRIFERHFYAYIFIACIFYGGKCLLWMGFYEYQFHIHERNLHNFSYDNVICI